MVRKIVALFVAILALGLLTILIVFGLLHTQYAKPMVIYTLDKGLGIHVKSESIQYHYPNQVTFQNARFELPDQQPVEVAKLSVWLSTQLSTKQPITIHELLIDGASLSASQTPSITLLKQWQTENIALDHIDYSHGEMIINDLRLQLTGIELGDSVITSKGNVQLQASQFYYQGSSLRNLLVDGELDADNSKILGASFTWNKSSISTQAQIQNGRWSLVNTTIDRLDLDATAQDDPLLSILKEHVGHINSLDILNSTLSNNDMTVDNISASLENIDLDKSLWKQSEAYISVDADQLIWGGFEFIEPTLEVYANEERIEVADLDTQLEQGRIQLSGYVKPNEIKLDKLEVDGVKYIQEGDKPSLLDLFADVSIDDLKSVAIDRVAINRSQWIQLSTKPFWQVTGFNMEASDLLLKRDYQWGLWQGKATASANSASIDKILANQVIMETESKQGKWQLNRLFIPFEQGYFTSTASLDFGAPSQPLALNAKAFSLPLALTHYLFDSDEIQLTGTADLDLDISALIADNLSLSQTLSGSLRSSFYNTEIQTRHSEQPQALEVTPLKITADRGVVELESLEISGVSIEGSAGDSIDLHSQSMQAVTIKLAETCKAEYELHILTGEVVSSPLDACP